MINFREGRIPLDPRQGVGAEALVAKAVNPPAEIDFSEINSPGLNQLLKSHIEMMAKALGAETAFLYTTDWWQIPFYDSMELIFKTGQMKIDILPNFTNGRLELQWVFCEKTSDPNWWSELTRGPLETLEIAKNSLNFKGTLESGDKVNFHIDSKGEYKKTVTPIK